MQILIFIIIIKEIHKTKSKDSFFVSTIICMYLQYMHILQIHICILHIFCTFIIHMIYQY